MSREDEMVVLTRDADGTPTSWCDPEIVDLVTVLNTNGLKTVSSCSGHGHRPGFITMKDGRVLLVCASLAEARKADHLWPDANGYWNTRHGAGDAERSAELTTAWMAGVERERERAAANDTRTGLSFYSYDGRVCFVISVMKDGIFKQLYKLDDGEWFTSLEDAARAGERG